MPPTVKHLPIISMMLFASVASVAAADGGRAPCGSLDAAGHAWLAAHAARDADAMAALVTEDVVLLDPDAPPLVGRQAARAAWRETATGWRMSVTVKEQGGSGEFGWRLGVIYYATPAGARVRSGRFLELWKCEDGAWKLHRHLSPGALGTRPALSPRPVPTQPRTDRMD